MYLAWDALENIAADQVMVTVNHKQCKEDKWEKPSCEAGDLDYVVHLAAIMLFLSFIASDIGGAIRLILTGKFWMKIAGALVLTEAVVATVCCSAMAQLGGRESGSEAIVACVGVAFIHDLDEAVRLVYVYSPKNKQIIAIIVTAVLIGGASMYATLETSASMAWWVEGTGAVDHDDFADLYGLPEMEEDQPGGDPPGGAGAFDDPGTGGAFDPMGTPSP